jgi:hypothetical protein
MNVADQLEAILASNSVDKLQPYQDLVEACEKLRQAFEEKLQRQKFDQFVQDFILLFQNRISSQKCAWSAEAL